MIFFTHWGFIIITMAVTIDACLVSYRFSNQRSKIFAKRRSALQENCHWTLQTSIFITAIAYPLAIFVTIAFWSFIHDWSHPFNLNLGNYLNLNVHLFQVESSHISVQFLFDQKICYLCRQQWHYWTHLSVQDLGECGTCGAQCFWV